MSLRGIIKKIEVANVTSIVRPLTKSTNKWSVSNMANLIIPKKCLVAECERNSTTAGYCQKHYVRNKKYGNPHTVLRKHGEGKTFAERFWSRVDKTTNSNGCWEWQGTIEKTGYGHVEYKGKTWKTHRMAWLLTYEKVPVNCILHACDNRKCVNPNHLREGTHKENSQDMVKRKRSLFGEKQNSAKITDEIVKSVRQMLANGKTQKEVTEILNLSFNIVHGIKSGRTWKHVK